MFAGATGYTKHMKARVFIFLAALGALTPARAATCEAMYQAGSARATGWFKLGEVGGGDMKRACLAKAKNDLGNRGLSELGFAKPPACDSLPVNVSIWVRVDGKGTADQPDAAVSSKLGIDCAAKPKKPAKG